MTASTKSLYIFCNTGYSRPVKIRHFSSGQMLEHKITTQMMWTMWMSVGDTAIYSFSFVLHQFAFFFFFGHLVEMQTFVNNFVLRSYVRIVLVVLHIQMLSYICQSIISSWETSTQKTTARYIYFYHYWAMQNNFSTYSRNFPLPSATPPSQSLSGPRST